VNSDRSELTNRVHRKITDLASSATLLVFGCSPGHSTLCYRNDFGPPGSRSIGPGTTLVAPQRRRLQFEPPTRITSNTEAAIQVWTSSANARWAAKPAWAAGMASKNTLLGQQYAQPVEATVKLIQDPVITEYVNRVSQNIVHNSGLAGSVQNLLVLNLLVLNCFRRSLPI
jgi:hypothetical protein